MLNFCWSVYLLQWLLKHRLLLNTGGLWSTVGLTWLLVQNIYVLFIELSSTKYLYVIYRIVEYVQIVSHVPLVVDLVLVGIIITQYVTVVTNRETRDCSVQCVERLTDSLLAMPCCSVVHVKSKFFYKKMYSQNCFILPFKGTLK